MALAAIQFLGRAKAQIAKVTTAEPVRMIKLAVAKADVMTDHAAQEAAKVLVQPSLAAMQTQWRSHPAFRRYFGVGELTRQQMTKVCDVIITLNDRLDKGLTIKVRPVVGRGNGLCFKGRSAYQAAGFTGTRTMNLCRDWFEITTADLRGAILIHEMVHATGIGWTRDLPVRRPAETAAEARQFALNDPRNARRNPLNMEHFMLAIMDRNH